MNSDIHFILTGGTIDSVFSPKQDAIVVNDHSVILDYIHSVIQPHVAMTAETLTLKDSRDITDNIREEIIASIKKCDAHSIVITHGTYTMPETARYLRASMPDIDKAVVLTGSMLPIKGFSESDATYNLGYAIAASQFLKPGIYLAMNSHIFDPEKVTKDTEKAVFVDS